MNRTASFLVAAWRGLPRPIRLAAHLTLQAQRDLVRPYRVGPRRPADAPGPIYCVGFHSDTLGLSHAARLLSAGLRRAGYEVVDIDVDRRAPRRAALPGRLEGGMVLSVLNPPELLLFADGPGARLLRGRRHVSHWAWELPQAPTAWARALPYVDEIWAPSAFTAQALSGIAGATPVRVAPYPVLAPPAAPSPPRAPDAPATVFFAFDLKSWMSRKNPQGAIAAFRRATQLTDRPARLRLKVSGADARPDALAALRRDLDGDPRIELILERLSDAEMSALVAGADVVLSLHRAEGFGLLLAEAMRAGVPVVATGWSGNLEFMDETGAALVAARPVQAGPEAGDYAGGCWVEPDVEEAAVRLAALIDSPEARADLGERGRRAIHARLGMDRWTAEVAGLLPATLTRT